MKKLLSIALIVALFVSVFAVTPVFAGNDDDGGSKTGVLDNFKAQGITGDEGSGLTNIAEKIVGAIQFISILATIVLVAVFGFQFIMGSAEQKADYQKKFIPLIVGVVVVFSVTTIARLLINTFTIEEDSGAGDNDPETSAIVESDETIEMAIAKVLAK